MVRICPADVGGELGGVQDRPPSAGGTGSIRFGSRAGLGQNGEEITSPPARVAAAAQVPPSIEFFMKWTEPSPNRTLAPPGCQLRAAFQPIDSAKLLP